MNIGKNYKLEEAVYKDSGRKGEEGREKLRNIYVRNGKAHATDGRSVCIVPVDLAEGEPEEGYITPEALKHCRKACDKEIPCAIVSTTETEIKSFDGVIFPRPSKDDVYPTVEKVFPDTREGYKLFVALDPVRLMKLAKAMGATTVLLEVKNEKEIILVSPNSDNNRAQGGLMPVQIYKTNELGL